MNIEELTSGTLALGVKYKRHGKKDGSAPSVGSKIYSEGLHAWNDKFAIAEEKASGGARSEQTIGVIVKASDLLSRAIACRVREGESVPSLLSQLKRVPGLPSKP